MSATRDHPIGSSTPNSSTSDARTRALRRLALVSFVAFGALGLHFPFFTPALLVAGMSSTAVGLMWSARSATHVFSPSLFGFFADVLGKSKLLAAVALASLGTLSLSLAVVEDEATGIVVFALSGLLGGASSSLIDGLVLTTLGSEKRRFGSVRVFGSIGFGVVALTFAVVSDVVALPRETAFIVAGLLSLTASVLVLTVPLEAEVRLASVTRAARLLWQRELLIVGLVTLFLWSSHGAYSAFLAPLAASHGLSGTGLGVALAFAIVCEVVAMRASVVLLERFGARAILVVSSGTAVLRWALLATTSSPLAFVLAQGLHGITFGLFYPAVVTFVGALVPDEARQTAQGALVAGFFGLGGVLGTAVAGRTFGVSSTTTWGAMAVLALVALAVSTRAAKPPITKVA